MRKNRFVICTCGSLVYRVIEWRVLFVCISTCMYVCYIWMAVEQNRLYPVSLFDPRFHKYHCIRTVDNRVMPNVSVWVTRVEEYVRQYVNSPECTSSQHGCVTVLYILYVVSLPPIPSIPSHLIPSHSIQWPSHNRSSLHSNRRACPSHPIPCGYVVSAPSPTTREGRSKDRRTGLDRGCAHQSSYQRKRKKNEGPS
ncbi:hypothetical protein DFP73DRAFT_62403 [Morchella snyderi]|nr:hypothetical protein DFP73DRAFT_62403 [Morchella snyderi]